MPAQTLSTATVMVAQDLGLFRREGLDVTLRTVVGIGAPNAVLAGSAQFTLGSGPAFLRAASQGQAFLAIANVVDRPLVGLVLADATAKRLGIDARLPLDERARRLKGLVIAIQGVGSINHAWLRYIVHRGGLDADKDVSVVPMDPPAMLPALRRGVISGYVTSPPYTTEGERTGDVVVIADAEDVTELLPFPYGLIYTTPRTCTTNRPMCEKMARAFVATASIIHKEPAKVYDAVIAKRFGGLPKDILAPAWDSTRRAFATDVRVSGEQLERAWRLNVGARLQEPSQLPGDLSRLFTNAFLTAPPAR